AGAHRELPTAAATLGLFATQYIASTEHYSVEQRSHYTQMVGALAEWGRSAPLGDAALAREALPQLVGAARTSGLAGPDGLRRTGCSRHNAADGRAERPALPAPGNPTGRGAAFPAAAPRAAPPVVGAPAWPGAGPVDLPEHRAARRGGAPGRDRRPRCLLRP